MTKTQELQSLLDEIIKEYPATRYTHVEHKGDGWYLLGLKTVPVKFIGTNCLLAKASLESYRDVLSVRRSGGAA